jgi:site-specific DNA-methyltransferase (adenine-specific)
VTEPRLGNEPTDAVDPAVAPAKRATSTSNFGVSRRENHDASDFYARFTPPNLSTDATVNPYGPVDWIHHGDARTMDEGAERLKTNSVALVVTSPPYFAGKAYEEELGSGHIPADYLDYLQMLEDVFAECVRTLEPGGRIAVNVANLGRKPYRSLSADIITILQDRLRLLMRGEVIWWKGKGASGSCAWGSFKKPSNPVLRDLTERVIIASKGRFDRAVPESKRDDVVPVNEFGQALLWADDFMDMTTDLWEIPTESARRVGHPAPFPVELPKRLIELYTYPDELVLDPFMGEATAVSGSAPDDYVGTTPTHYVTEPGGSRRWYRSPNDRRTLKEMGTHTPRAAGFVDASRGGRHRSRRHRQFRALAPTGYGCSNSARARLLAPAARVDAVGARSPRPHRPRCTGSRESSSRRARSRRTARRRRRRRRPHRRSHRRDGTRRSNVRRPLAGERHRTDAVDRRALRSVSAVLRESTVRDGLPRLPTSATSTSRRRPRTLLGASRARRFAAHRRDRTSAAGNLVWQRARSRSFR